MCKQPKVPAPARAPARVLAGVLAALLLPVDAAGAAPFGCLPLYGNWCGPGHPGGRALPPVDVFDAACMRHDLCTAGPWGQTACDRAFVDELHLLAAQTGGLPRPLQWAEYLIRLKAGGGWGGMPMPLPGDAMGLMSSVMTPCW